MIKRTTKLKFLVISLALGLGVTAGVLWGLTHGVLALAAPRLGNSLGQMNGTELHVCHSGCDYASVQSAVDAANEGDVIKVAAGIYTDVHVRPRNDFTTTGVVSQVVYISKTVNIQGGYTVTNWTTPKPEDNPTTLDARGQGRVLYITGNISPTIAGVRLIGGNANGLGGDMWGGHAGGGVYGISAAVTLSNSQVSSNTAYYGGGVYLDGDNTVLSNNAIFSNTSQNGGGAYMTWSWNVTLSGNTFYSNIASSLGGGMYLWYCRHTRMDGNIIHNNKADGGGGIYLWGGNHSDTLLSNNVIFNNMAHGGGGLSMWDSGDVALTSNSIYSNTAQESGGGLTLSSSSPKLDGNTILNNKAFYGGGIWLRASSYPILINDVIVGNQATFGGGLYILGANPRLFHTTIARNGSSGIYVGIYSGSPMRYSRMALTNTILVSQTVGIMVTAGNTATLQATLWGSGTWANTTDWDGVGTIITGTPAYNYWGNPAFVDADSGNYHLDSRSAAIDRGVDTETTTDIDGDHRPVGARPDIGADEVRRRVYLPLIARNLAPPVTFPVHIGDAIPARSATYQGEVFYTTSVQIPDTLSPGGRFYISSQSNAVAQVMVDDALVVLLNGIEVFTFSFSSSTSSPEPAIVEVPRTTMEELAGQTTIIDYRDVYGAIVQATEIWLIWVP